MEINAVTYFIIGLVVYLLIANVLITRHVWLDSRRTTNEKIAEVGLLWLVPFLGHLVALAISLDGPENARQVDPRVTTGGVVGAVTGTF